MSTFAIIRLTFLEFQARRNKNRTFAVVNSAECNIIQFKDNLHPPRTEPEEKNEIRLDL